MYDRFLEHGFLLNRLVPGRIELPLPCVMWREFNNSMSVRINRRVPRRVLRNHRFSILFCHHQVAVRRKTAFFAKGFFYVYIYFTLRPTCVLMGGKCGLDCRLHYPPHQNANNLLVELSVARIIWHGHPHGYPCGYPSKWSRSENIRIDICTLCSFTWIFMWISVQMSVSNNPCYGQFNQPPYLPKK